MDADFAAGINHIKAKTLKLTNQQLAAHVKSWSTPDTPAEFDEYVAWCKDLLASRTAEVETVEVAAPRKTGNCYKCDGTGHINAFRHRDAGACYACNGTGNRKLSACDHEDAE
jgi:hypothetical protein